MGFKSILRRILCRPAPPAPKPKAKRRAGDLRGTVLYFDRQSEAQVLEVGNSAVHIGRHSYARPLDIRQWSEGAALRIGAFCSLSSSITLMLGGNHTAHWVSTYPLPNIFPNAPPATLALSKGDIVIGPDVWIGHGATILSGVTIGAGAIVGARAVVAKDVAPYAVVVGNPAREIRKRFPDPIIALLLKLAWWDLPDDEIATFLPDLMAEPDEARLQALIAQYRPAP